MWGSIQKYRCFLNVSVLILTLKGYRSKHVDSNYTISRIFFKLYLLLSSTAACRNVLRCISLPSLTSLLKVTIHVLTTAVYVKTHWQEVDIDDHLCGASVVSWEVASVEFVSWCSTHSYSYRCCFVKFCIKYLYHKGSSLGFTFYWWRHVSKIYPGRQRQQKQLLLLPLES